jgi:hypothetical protein
VEELMASGRLPTLLFFLFLNIGLIGTGIMIAKHLDKKNENR